MELVLNSGKKVEIGITFRKLAELREKNKKAYEEYNRVVTIGAKDVFDYIAVIYAGYCCNVEGPAMGYQTFLDELPVDINEVIDAFNSLVTRPKKQALPMKSENEQAG